MAQLPAFPGAEGAGRNTTGGRGTTVTAPTIYEVTTLTDSSTSATTPGTLRYAATHSGPVSRTIVFRVAGTIHLYMALQFTRANTTIAGQTAPGDGICLADYPVQVNANNIIIRYIRFRMGDKNQNLGMVPGSGNDDAFDDASHNHNHIILDHCTMSWSDDEACSFYGGDSLTIQWSFITEPLNYSYHFEAGDVDYEHHGYGGIWGGAHATFHHNLLAHCQGRVPRFDGRRNIAAETADFRNNVLYDWGIYNTNGGEGGSYNIVNNYYKYGLSTSNSTSSGVTIKYEVINPYKQASPVIPYGKYYLDGNYVDGSTATTVRNWLGAAMSGGTYADTTSAQALVPFTIMPVVTQSATDAYSRVLANAGVTLPNRDTLDSRIVNDVLNRTGKIIDVQGGFAHGTPYAQTVTAWPTLAPGFAPTDSDHDGMPDAWETQRGLNPNSNADLNLYTSTTGYNNIETYLNGDTIVAPGTLNTCITAKTIYSSSTGNWLNANDSIYGYYNSPSYLISTDTNNVVASVLDNGNYGSFTASYYTTNALRTDAVTGKPYLNRNITITPSNPSLISSPLTVRIYISKAELDALKAADPTIVTINDVSILETTDNTCVTILGSSYSVILPTATGVFGNYLNGYFIEFHTSSFGTFFIGSKVSFPVPLKLLSFTALADNTATQKIVNTAWTTDNEVNTDRFQVERSSDWISFYSIGSVPAINNINTHFYAFTDNNPLNGISYYRLKMVDRSGYFTYSQVISINIRGNNRLTISPNPVHGFMVIHHGLGGKNASVRIISEEGRLTAKYLVSPGVTKTTINTSFLIPGAYAILFTDDQQSLVTRFIKQ